MVAARLIEFGYPLQTQARISTIPSSSEKGKGLEVVNPLMIENIAASHTVPLGKTKVLEEMTDMPMVLEKGTPTIEEELKAMKEEMKRMSDQLKVKNNHDFWERTGDGSRERLSDRFYDLDKFDGDGDPTIHLNQYILTARWNRWSASFMLDWFPLFLQGPALMWYYTLERSKRASWTELSKAFLDEFSVNTMMNMGLGELKVITQNLGESFPDYFKRWRRKMITIRGKPDEQELIRIFIKGILSPFQDQMYSTYFRNFSEVYLMGIGIENRLLEEKKVSAQSSTWSRHDKNINDCSSSKREHKRASRPKNSKLGVRRSVNFVRSGK